MKIIPFPSSYISEITIIVDWEQRKLSEITDLIDGDRGNNYPSGDDFSGQGHTLFLSAANVTKNGFTFESKQYITEEKSRALGNGKLELNDILLTSRGSIGHVAWYHNDIKLLIPFARINSGMLILRSKEDVESSYIEQYLKSLLGKRQIDLISFGSAQPQLTKKDVSNYKIFIPRKTEQAKLGGFFNKLDNAITLHQRKLDALKRLKEAYLQNMFPKNGESAPKLRFADFSESWEQRKLSEVTDKLKSYPLSRSAETVEYTGLKYIHYGDIHTGKANIVDINSDLPNINPGDYESLQKGDITLADASEDYQGIASPAVIIDEVPYKLISGLHTIALRPTMADSLFLYYLFTSPTFKRFGYRVGTGMKVFGISISNLLKFNTYYPSIEEQDKIRNLLKKLNDTIELHQHKLEQCQQLKNSYLQKMFI